MYKTVTGQLGDSISASIEIRSSSRGFDLPDDTLIIHAKQAFLRTRELTEEQVAQATYSVFDHLAAKHSP